MVAAPAKPKPEAPSRGAMFVESVLFSLVFFWEAQKLVPSPLEKRFLSTSAGMVTNGYNDTCRTASACQCQRLLPVHSIPRKDTTRWERCARTSRAVIFWYRTSPVLTSISPSDNFIYGASNQEPPMETSVQACVPESERTPCISRPFPLRWMNPLAVPRADWGLFSRCRNDHRNSAVPPKWFSPGWETTARLEGTWPHRLKFLCALKRRRIVASVFISI